ncbi:hypothetical protein Vretimale_10482 [Volvox reticuliferus]|uniref:Smr domain-containing protein n=1 Tax=Volvox reticuliferus TaxID=1737510 RepID=A0A8J4GFR1_9CHLO|nr:hypothetical protein Vretimale_10482 [Volvox reticuliferus]
MLNVSAKEFVPAASPKPAAVITIAPAKDSEQRAAEDVVHRAGADKNPVCGSGGTGAALPKPQLSPMAPAFVPRGCGYGKVAAAAMSCSSDSAADTNPPRSVLTPPRSDSTLSSSLPSLDPETPEGYGQEGTWYVEDQAATKCVAYDNGGGGNTSYCYYYPDLQQQGEQQYDECGGYGAVQGEEPAPGNVAYDQYGYGMYDDYTAMSYNNTGMDTLGAPVYYGNTSYTYDGAQQEYDSQYAQGAYFWDESTSAWMYGDAQQYGAAGSGGEYASAAAVGCWPLPSSFQTQPEHMSSEGGAAAGWDSMAAPLSWADDVEASADTGTGGAGADIDVADLELDLGGGEQFRSVEPSDAAELLEMFFPHYAGEALSRLLSRTGGDLTAAFAELAAMERQAFPALPPSPSPLALAKMLAPAGPPDRADATAADAGQQPEASEVASDPPAKDAADESITASAVITTAGPGAAAVPSVGRHAADVSAAAASPSRPKLNFASLLRNSHSGPPPYGGWGGCSTSSVAACNGGRGGIRGPRGLVPASAAAAAAAAAAVPWVSTGAAVSSQYLAEREEASMLARARNQCFQQATMAYLSGNKALAKKLGRRGRELNEAMKAAHAAAARRIFAQRNGRAAPGAHNYHNHHSNGNGNHSSKHHPHHHPSRRHQHQHPHPQNPHRQHVGDDGAAAAGVGEGLFVDLHGLHAAEAVAVLEAQIEQARAAGCRILRVCTGAGHHTKGSKTPARLPAAVADALLSNHLTFKTLKPGLLEARL